MIWLLLPAVLLGLAWFAVFAWVPGRRYRMALPTPYDVVTRHPLPKLLGSGACVVGRRVLLKAGHERDITAAGLAHEYCHTTRTSWFRYLWSAKYREQEEEAARAYATTNWPKFEMDAATIRTTSGG